MSDMLSHHISILYRKVCILFSREKSLGLAILQGEGITQELVQKVGLTAAPLDSVHHVDGCDVLLWRIG